MGMAIRSMGGACAAVARRPREAVLRELLGSFAGWKPLPTERRLLRVMGGQYHLAAIAQCAQWRVELCESPGSPCLPAYTTRRLLQRRAGEAVLTVFSDAAATRQVWTWRRRMPFGASAHAEAYPDPRDPPDPALLLEEPRGVKVDDPDAAEGGAEAARGVLLGRLGRQREIEPLLRQGRGVASASRLQRLVEEARRAEVPRTVWREATALRLLDPACGTGSWLAGGFAALVAVAAACLQRMRAWVQDRSGTRSHPDFRHLLARCGDAATPGGCDRYARETVLLRCLYGVETSCTAAARARALLAGWLDAGGTSENEGDRLAFADIRNGRLEEGAVALLERRASPLRGGVVEVPAGVELESEVLGRAWGQVIGVRLLAGAPAGEVAEGRDEIARRREALYRLLPETEGDGTAKRWLHPRLEFDEVVRDGGFDRVRLPGSV